MPGPHDYFFRPSKLRDAASRPGDDAETCYGGWSLERLLVMDARYCEAMRKALVVRPKIRAAPKTRRSEPVHRR
jgi:hypothetical protein